MQMVSNHPGDVDMITKSLNEISGDFAEQDIKEKSAPKPFQGLHSPTSTGHSSYPSHPATFPTSHPSRTFGAG